MFKKTAGKKVFEFLVPKPKVNKTKLQKAQSALDKAAGKLKGKTAELEQIRFESKYGMPFTFAKSSKKTKSNTEFKTGLYVQESGTVIDESILWIREKETRSKIYVNLSPVTSNYFDATSFKLYIKMERNFSISENKILN